jgi:peptidoglycan/LPS O-acetylase OafA/YrhL
LAFVALATLRYDEPATLNFIGFELRLDMSQEAILKAVTFGLFCTSMSFATIAIALRFANRRWAAWRFLDAMNPVAYGIFLMHFTFIIWLQYAVYSIQIPAIVKFTFVFAGALSGSWIMTRALRSSPVIARMI